MPAFKSLLLRSLQPVFTGPILKALPRLRHDFESKDSMVALKEEELSARRRTEKNLWDVQKEKTQLLSEDLCSRAARGSEGSGAGTF